MRGDLALVLSGGGARASYQVGVLKALAEVAPDLRFQIITGVSAGAINTVSLAANPGALGTAAADLERQWNRLTSDQVYRLRPVSVAGALVRLFWHALTREREGPPAFRGVMEMEPLRTFLETAVDLRGIGRNIEAGRLRAVALSATSYTTGWTTTFVQASAEIPMWRRAQRMAVRAEITFDHLLASAAIPLIFPAVTLGTEFFGDGSVRQHAPLAPAIHLGARRILAIGMRRRPAPAVPVRSDPADYPSAAQVAGLLLHSIFLDALETDAERLERINRTLRRLPAEAESPDQLRPIDLLMLRPSRDLGVMAGDYPIELPAVVRSVVRAIGGERAQASDFLSYLMFDPPYTTDLMQLGYEDTLAERGTLEQFLVEA